MESIFKWSKVLFANISLGNGLAGGFHSQTLFYVYTRAAWCSGDMFKYNVIMSLVDFLGRPPFSYGCSLQTKPV